MLLEPVTSLAPFLGLGASSTHCFPAAPPNTDQEIKDSEPRQSGPKAGAEAGGAPAAGRTLCTPSPPTLRNLPSLALHPLHTTSPTGSGGLWRASRSPGASGDREEDKEAQWSPVPWALPWGPKAWAPICASPHPRLWAQDLDTCRPPPIPGHSALKPHHVQLLRPAHEALCSVDGPHI